MCDHARAIGVEMFKVYRDRAGEWRWRLRAANGRIVADSGEGYSSRTNAERAVQTFRALVETAQVRVAPPRRIVRPKPQPAPLLRAIRPKPQPAAPLLAALMAQRQQRP
jgi:uncharacterized protein YegP (UPF0339 family)